LLLLHGNPTWSFLYRVIIKGLRDSFRCVALDYPGFGFSTTRAGYGFTPAEHANIVERFLLTLDHRDVTLMVQDWGGPIGLGCASQHSERFRALIVGNTWAWPVNGYRHFEWFSKLFGGPLGGFAIRNFNAFVNLFIPAGVKRRKLPKERWLPTGGHLQSGHRGSQPTSSPARSSVVMTTSPQWRGEWKG
jgi:haloalkane dehalogenase